MKFTLLTFAIATLVASSNAAGRPGPGVSYDAMIQSALAIQAEKEAAQAKEGKSISRKLRKYIG